MNWRNAAAKHFPLAYCVMYSACLEAVSITIPKPRVMLSFAGISSKYAYHITAMGIAESQMNCIVKDWLSTENGCNVWLANSGFRYVLGESGWLPPTVNPDDMRIRICSKIYRSLILTRFGVQISPMFHWLAVKWLIWHYCLMFLLEP